MARSAAKPMHGLMPPGASTMPVERGEHHQRHDARLQSK
jgi:hypothetical protein